MAIPSVLDIFLRRLTTGSSSISFATLTYDRIVTTSGVPSRSNVFFGGRDNSLL